MCLVHAKIFRSTSIAEDPQRVCGNPYKTSAEDTRGGGHGKENCSSAYGAAGKGKSSRFSAPWNTRAASAEDPRKISAKDVYLQYRRRGPNSSRLALSSHTKMRSSILTYPRIRSQKCGHPYSHTLCRIWSQKCGHPYSHTPEYGRKTTAIHAHIP